nr:MAG TPA: hypothetical protein [Caudoviricetes sp.]
MPNRRLRINLIMFPHNRRYYYDPFSHQFN